MTTAHTDLSRSGLDKLTIKRLQAENHSGRFVFSVGDVAMLYPQTVASMAGYNGYQRAKTVLDGVGLDFRDLNHSQWDAAIATYGDIQSAPADIMLAGLPDAMVFEQKSRLRHIGTVRDLLRVKADHLAVPFQTRVKQFAGVDIITIEGNLRQFGLSLA